MRKNKLLADCRGSAARMIKQTVKKNKFRKEGKKNQADLAYRVILKCTVFRTGVSGGALSTEMRAVCMLPPCSTAEGADYCWGQGDKGQVTL